MATITYPAMDLGAPERAPKRSRRRRNAAAATQAQVATAAALAGLGVMALSGAAATAWRRPEFALGGLLLGALTAGLIFEHGGSAR